MIKIIVCAMSARVLHYIMKITSYLIPKDLNLSSLLAAHILKRWDKPIIRDKFYYIIDNLHLKAVVRENRNYKEYHNLSAVLLQEVLGTKFALPVRDALLRMGIIETDSKYAPFKKCTGYRLAEEYVNRGFEGIAPADPKLVKRVIAQRKRQNDLVASKSSVYRKIQDTMAKISFDEHGAKEYLTTTAFESEGRREKRALYIKIFVNREFTFGLCPFGRYHYPLTNISKDLRKFITLEGQHLWSVDVSCSQLFLIGCLGYQKEGLEKNKFMSLCKSGSLYEYINSKLEIPYDLDESEQKRKLKTEIFHRIAYGSNYGDALTTDIYRVFNQEFPKLSSFIKVEKKFRHALFNHKLQKFESKIILRIAALDFVTQFPAAPLLSIHDCLLTSETYVQNLKQCMSNAFIRECKVEAHFKESKFDK